MKGNEKEADFGLIYIGKPVHSSKSQWPSEILATRIVQKKYTQRAEGTSHSPPETTAPSGDLLKSSDANVFI